MQITDIFDIQYLISFVHYSGHKLQNHSFCNLPVLPEVQRAKLVHALTQWDGRRWNIIEYGKWWLGLWATDSPEFRRLWIHIPELSSCQCWVLEQDPWHSLVSFLNCNCQVYWLNIPDSVANARILLCETYCYCELHTDAESLSANWSWGFRQI